jgi:hypothetical protein
MVERMDSVRRHKVTWRVDMPAAEYDCVQTGAARAVLTCSLSLLHQKCASQARPSHCFGSEYAGLGHGVVERIVAFVVVAANAQVNRVARSRVPAASSPITEGVRITLLVLGLSAIRVVRTLLIVAVVNLLRFVRVPALDLSIIFTVALVTRVVAASGKQVRGGGRRRSSMILAPRIARFLFVSMGRPSVLAPARSIGAPVRALSATGTQHA